jgi:hypothetical protein
MKYDNMIAWGRDNGDGSFSVYVFKHQEALEQYLEANKDYCPTLEEIESYNDPYENGYLHVVGIGFGQKDFFSMHFG